MLWLFEISRGDLGPLTQSALRDETGQRMLNQGMSALARVGTRTCTSRYCNRTSGHRDHPSLGYCSESFHFPVAGCSTCLAAGILGNGAKI